MSAEIREKIVSRIAREFKDGMVVNLGIGMPTLAANHVPPGVEIILQSENGFVGMGAQSRSRARGSRPDKRRQPAGDVLPGAAFFDSAFSFGIIRGGHLDITVLGALEVDARGNIANYIIPREDGRGHGRCHGPVRRGEKGNHRQHPLRQARPAPRSGSAAPCRSLPWARRT
jgi:3-oxoacid CoA-transferase B subunit